MGILVSLLHFCSSSSIFIAVVVLHLIGVVGYDMLRLAEGRLDTELHRSVALTVAPVGRVGLPGANGAQSFSSQS